MFDFGFLRENTQQIVNKLADRGEKWDPAPVLHLIDQRSQLKQKAESLRAERNQQSKDIGARKKKGEDITQVSQAIRNLGQDLEQLEKDLEGVELQLQEQTAVLANLPQDSVPKGKSAADNPVLRTWGEKTRLDFKPKDHVDLGQNLQILDFERAAKISGARFALYRNQGAALERALINFMLDLHTREHGYEEVLPPFMVLPHALYGTGNLPKFKEDLFQIDGQDLFLIPTAEVPVTNIHREEILAMEEMPKAYVAYTPCFRSEAGSYGKDVRGLIRQHQFNKVELVRFVTPEKSNEELDLLTSHAETVLQKLGLHYRVVELCTGDLGFASSKTFDLEVWLPGQNAYREISSCSNFTDFQARRAMIRYRPQAKGKPQLVHTLNGSGLAIGRTVVAILEQFQQKDGTVIIPDILRPYLNGLEKIELRN